MQEMLVSGHSRKEAEKFMLEVKRSMGSKSKRGERRGGDEDMSVDQSDS
jgi:hypothetical protein